MSLNVFRHDEDEEMIIAGTVGSLSSERVSQGKDCRLSATFPTVDQITWLANCILLLDKAESFLDRGTPLVTVKVLRSRLMLAERPHFYQNSYRAGRAAPYLLTSKRS